MPSTTQTCPAVDGQKLTGNLGQEKLKKVQGKFWHSEWSKFAIPIPKGEQMWI